jgi:hypothetical protein
MASMTSCWLYVVCICLPWLKSELFLQNYKCGGYVPCCVTVNTHAIVNWTNSRNVIDDYTVYYIDFHNFLYIIFVICIFHCTRMNLRAMILQGSAGRICHLENVKSYFSYLQQCTKIIKMLTFKAYFSQIRSYALTIKLVDGTSSAHSFNPYAYSGHSWSYFDIQNLRLVILYRTVTSARSCNNVGHLFWFTILKWWNLNDQSSYFQSILKYNLLGLHSRNGHELWCRLCQQTGKIQIWLHILNLIKIATPHLLHQVERRKMNSLSLLIAW